jgi:murein DD-endopeptidase MepM/ murein hydrolase activator NlpD
MKKDRLIITISDIDKTKSYNVNKVIKKVLFWVIISIVTIVGVSFFIISKLSDNVHHLSLDRIKLQKENQLYSKKIEQKKELIKQLGSELENIEKIIGINQDDTASLIQRATLAKITSAQKMYMLQTIPSGCPLKQCIITSPFGWRQHPTLHSKQFHNGIDLRAARRTPVYATADGVVRYVQDKNEGTFGRVIIIAHNFGFETVYGHLRFTLVKVGDVVKKGQLIAKSGNSGRSNGPHLHYEVRHASKVLDPKDFINWNMQNYETIFNKQRRVKWDSLIKLINNQHKILAQQ